MTEKRCTFCGDVKPRDQFSKSSRAVDGLQHNCKSCQKARRKAQPCSVEGCIRAHLARGLCTTHWNEWRRQATEGDLARRRFQTLEEALEGRAEATEDGCLVWTSNVGGREPYGVITFAGKRVYAHRAAYEIANGPISADVEIDHICHNTLCVNPEHLRIATHKQNAENLQGAHANSLTSVRGVTFDRARNQYRARIKHNYQEIHLGRFNTIEEAESAVIAARRQYFTHSD